MVSTAMSKIALAAGRADEAEGRKGARWRQRRTGIGIEGSKSLAQSVWSSIKIRRVVRLSME